MVAERTDTFIPLQNPYTFGVPVRGKNFFGREQEIQMVMDTLERVPRGQKQDMVVMGPRRIGKSSLLYRLVDLLQSHQDFLPVYVDVQNIKPRTPRLLFFKMLKEIQQGYRAKELLASLPTFDFLTAETLPEDLIYLTFDDDISRLNETIAAQHLPRLVLLFDEVELLTEFGGTDILGWFRSLIQHNPSILFIVAGSELLYSLTQDYGSPFYNIFKTVELHPLTDKVARNLLEQPAQAIGMHIATEQVTTILYTTGNTPYFIQGIAHYLVEHLNQQRRYTVQSQDIAIVMQQSSDYFAGQFGYIWNIVGSHVQRGILYALAKAGQPQTIDALIARVPAIKDMLPAERQQQEIFDDLLQQQVLKQEQTGYWFLVPLFRDWILAKVDDEEVLRLAKMSDSYDYTRTTEDQIDRRKLREIIVKYFSLEELEILLADLEIDFEIVGGSGSIKASKVLHLIDYLDRRGRLAELVAVIIEERPHISLEEINR